MRWLALFVLLLASIGLSEARQTNVFFVFLVRGEAKAPADKVEEMQAGHIANFKRLFAEHKLLAAGPLKDPTEYRRGIVVLQVPNAEAVRQCFNTDPYVQAGVMHLEVYRWEVNPKSIHREAIDPNAIEENRIVLLMSPEKADAQAKWPTVAKKVGGKVSGNLVGVGEIKEVRLFHGTASDEKLTQSFEKDPAVKSGAVRFRLLPLWLAKGTL